MKYRKRRGSAGRVRRRTFAKRKNRQARRIVRTALAQRIGRRK